MLDGAGNPTHLNWYQNCKEQGMVPALPEQEFGRKGSPLGLGLKGEVNFHQGEVYMGVWREEEIREQKKTRAKAT